MLVEAALIKLGTAAVRTAAKLWLGDQKIAAEVSASAVDFMSERLVSVRDKRKFNRMIDSFAEEVVNRVEPILEREFRGLEENERLATIEAVTDTFALASLADRDLFAADLDAGHLDRSIRARVPSQIRLLSASGTALYDLLLRECCGYILRNLRRLTHLALSHTSVTDIFPFAGLTDLQFLDLTGSRVSDISPLRKLTALQEIRLADSQIHDLSPLGPRAEIVRGPTSEPVSGLNPFAAN
jgi:Leucine-rich repeat (LRR) protein